MNSQLLREDSARLLEDENSLRGGAGRGHAGRTSEEEDGGGGADSKDIETAEMEELMDDILYPRSCSLASTAGGSSNGGTESHNEESAGDDDTRGSSVKKRGEESSSLRQGEGISGRRNSAKDADEELGRTVIGKARRRKSSAGGERGKLVRTDDGGDEGKASGGIVDRYVRGLAVVPRRQATARALLAESYVSSALLTAIRASGHQCTAV